MRTALFLGLVLLAGCAEDEPGAPPPPTPPATIAKAPPAEFRVTEGEEGALIWNKPGGYGNSVTILFDNGLEKPVTVAMSGKEKFEVAAGSHVFLKCPPAELHVRVFDAAGELIERADFTPESRGAYVCNAGAAWDYCVELGRYGNAEFLPVEGERYYFMNALSFFSVGHIDYWFEELPKTVRAFGVEGEIMTEFRRSFTRMEREPKRKVWIVEGPGGSAARMIRDEDERVLVQRVDSTVRPDGVMHAVSYLDDPVQLFVDGFPVKEIDVAGVDLVLEKGKHRLRAVAKGGKVYETEIDISEEYPTWEIDEEE